jgi:hypothetical protein
LCRPDSRVCGGFARDLSPAAHRGATGGGARRSGMPPYLLGAGPRLVGDSRPTNSTDQPPQISFTTREGLQSEHGALASLPRAESPPIRSSPSVSARSNRASRCERDGGRECCSPMGKRHSVCGWPALVQFVQTRRANGRHLGAHTRADSGRVASCLPRLASLGRAGSRWVLGDESGSWTKPRPASRWGP